MRTKLTRLARSSLTKQWPRDFGHIKIREGNRSDLCRTVVKELWLALLAMRSTTGSRRNKNRSCTGRIARTREYSQRFSFAPQSSPSVFPSKFDKLFGK